MRTSNHSQIDWAMLWLIKDSNSFLFQKNEIKYKQHEDDNRHLLQISKKNIAKNAHTPLKAAPKKQMYLVSNSAGLIKNDKFITSV